jgi:hypothetical protein
MDDEEIVPPQAYPQRDVRVIYSIYGLHLEDGLLLLPLPPLQE